MSVMMSRAAQQWPNKKNDTGDSMDKITLCIEREGAFRRFQKITRNDFGKTSLSEFASGIGLGNFGYTARNPSALEDEIAQRVIVAWLARLETILNTDEDEPDESNVPAND